MHLNQFARLTPDAKTQQQELASLGLCTSGDFATVASQNFRLLFPEAKTTARAVQQEHLIAVDATSDLADWLITKPTSMTRVEFYAVALQLLGFAPTTADLENSIAMMQAADLPVVASDLKDVSALLGAFYLLLNTRTPKLSVYLDDLFNRGFLKDHAEEYLFFNGKSQPTFDPHHLVREVVWVESDLDTDHDGQRDLLETTIFRPQATQHGVKMPVLFTANPYFHGTNDEAVEEATHVPATHLAVKTVSHTLAEVTSHDRPLPQLPKPVALGHTDTASQYGDEHGIYSLNDYFLPRGFVTVYSGGVGTRGSDGLRSVGGRSETLSATAVIEWLTGSRRAFVDRSRETEISAWWCNGNVAMTGKSYLGTLAIAAATSGVAGLKTVISEAAISSWYDYYRENGLVVAPGGFQGEDADVLAVDTFSRLKTAGDMLKLQPQWEASLAAITQAQDRESGDYNAWWDERNYRNQLQNIHCDIVSVHGLNDTNVKPANVIRLFKGLENLPIQKKLFLHQGQHVYLNNIRSLDFTDQMNLWLTNKLLDVDNGADAAIPDVTIQDNVTPETWHTQAHFGVENTDWSLATDFTSKRASFADTSTQIFNTEHDTSASFDKAIIQPTSAYADSRLWLEAQFDDALVLEGTPHVHLRLWIDQPTAILSVRLIDLGEDTRFGETATIVGRGDYQLGYDFKCVDTLEFQPSTATAAKLISYGHLNLQNPHNAYTTETITPGQAFTVDFDLQPTHYVLPKGRKLALIIHGADMAQTIRPVDVVNYHIDLDHSTIGLPLK